MRGGPARLARGTAFAALALAAAPVRGAAGAAVPPALADTSFLHQYAQTYGFRLGRPTAIEPAPDGRSVLFLRSGPRSFVQDLWELDVADGRERVRLTAEQVLRGAEERLTPEERAHRERLRSVARGIASFALSRDGRRLLVPLSGRLFVIDRAGNTMRELPSRAGAAADPRFSPDGEHVACVRDDDLYVTDLAGGGERRLTHRESADISYGTAEFVAQEEMDRFTGYWWSPDSKWIACQRTDTRNVERFHISDPAHPEQPPQAWAYPRPGKANADVTLGIVPVAGGAWREVSWDRKRWPYLARVSWEGNAPLTLLVQNRAQTEEAILAADAASGSTRVLHVESDPIWLNLDGELPQWLEDGSGFLWSSERGGTWQLERHDRTGRLVRALTPASLNYRGLLHVDPAGGTVWVAGGAEPTQRHVYRVRLDGRGVPERMTSAVGIHDASFGRGSAIWVDAWEGLDGRRRVTVRGEDGRPVAEVRSVAESPPVVPRVELMTIGRRGFRAALIRPAGSPRSRRLPVIVDVYGGPHAQQVLARASTYLLDQWLANQGFLVVRIDGRGTPARGRAWERVFRGDFATVPLEDQVEGLRAIAARVSQMDLARVGILGGSFGGYMACMAILRRPDVFHAAISNAPVVDWHDYDTHYTERYLGLPDRDSVGYARSSVLTYAHGLARPLLLIHGTSDDNVYFFHSLQLSDALTRNGTPAELWPILNQAHGVRDPLLVERLQARVADFFRRHLAEPR